MSEESIEHNIGVVEGPPVHDSWLMAMVCGTNITPQSEFAPYRLFLQAMVNDPPDSWEALRTSTLRSEQLQRMANMMTAAHKKHNIGQIDNPRFELGWTKLLHHTYNKLAGGVFAQDAAALDEFFANPYTARLETLSTIIELSAEALTDARVREKCEERKRAFLTDAPQALGIGEVDAQWKVALAQKLNERRVVVAADDQFSMRLVQQFGLSARQQNQEEAA